MKLIIFLICLYQVNSEIVKIPLHPVTGISSMLTPYRKLFRLLQRSWMNLLNVADTPTSEPLYNYGNIQYYGEVLVGTPPQKFRVLFDTGSTETWLPSRKCWFLDIPCWFIRFYDSSKSSTYKPNGTEFDINYLSGSYSGYWSMDTMQISSLVIRNQAFAEVTDVFSNDFFSAKFDGIVGMSRRIVSRYGNLPFFPNIFSQSRDMDPVFSFYLNRENGHVGGELVIGGVNPEYFIGDFESLPVVSDNRWSVIIKSMKIGGVDFCLGTCIGIIDTGTSLILGHSRSVDAVNNHLGASLGGGGEYSFDCNNIHMLPTIEFVFRRRTYVFSPKDYVLKVENWLYADCTSPFASSDGLSPGYWVLGDVFMSKFYTVFDFGWSQIKLADVNGG
uniref:Peptidase A1 domain-containing protein n=1 Tax=Trichobilharzia regenti TaxID=157069 RepID=A0AA85KD72_TRIRE|nr:unnamed protein product [Trichobilharzia regenti]